VKKRGAPKGNKNTAKGPRVGRKNKPVTKNIAGPALPQPKPGASLSHPPTGRPKVAGRDFQPGQNSHEGPVFRRGADQLPRGNMILHAKIVYHDTRKTLYDRQVEIAEKGSHANVLKLLDYLANRIHGTPTKHVEKTVQRQSNFYLTTREGEKQPLFPERQMVSAGSTPVAAASAEDELILGVVRVSEK
jgi:hypothetical protein